jgi:hypothetical protein
MKRWVVRVVVAMCAFGVGVVSERGVSVLRRAGEEKAESIPKVALTSPAYPLSTTYPAACPAATPLPTPQRPNVKVFAYNPVRFNPRGTYFPMERLPKAFREFDAFEVISEPGELFGDITIDTRIDKESFFQNAVFSLITEDRLFFVTIPQAYEDFAFRFDGKFTVNPAAWTDKRKAVVSGTLTKTKNGQTVAECVVSFRVAYLGC